MINLIVNNQELSIVTQKVVAGTHDYLTVEADFKGSEWTDMRKWVHFSMGEFKYILPMIDDLIDKDQHLDITEGTWEVYVHGNLIEDDEVTERVTTDIKYLFVDAPHDGHPFPPLTPTYEEMLANKVAEANEISQSIRDDVDAGTLDGATYLPSIDSEGIISWTNDKGKPNPEPVSIIGPQGEPGNNGVYIGDEAPGPEGNYKVWIKPSGALGKLITNVTATGTHIPGTYDTYLFEFSDGTSLTIPVYNGADGSGIGDMLKQAYDPTNKATDIFAYADAIKDKTAAVGLLKGDGGAIVAAAAGTDYQTPLAAGVDYQEPLTIDQSPTQGGVNPVSSGGVYTELEKKANTSGLASVAFSGQYSDLAGKPNIPGATTVDTALSDNSENPVQNKVIKQAIDGITTRPNPNPLKIKINGSTTSYDGTTEQEVTINTSSGSGDVVLTRLLQIPTVSVAAGAEEVAIFNYAYSGYTAIAIVEVKLTYGNNLVPVYWGTVTEQNGQIRVWNRGNVAYSGNPGYVRVLYKKN